MSYTCHTDRERARMLETVGVTGVDELFDAIPLGLRRHGLALSPGLSELETRFEVERLAAQNVPASSSSFLGAGCYRHYVPAAVRALVSRTEFATSYTPYQAEVSQGTLQGIFEFQTAICELTGLDIANASLYDGPSALAEAAFLALRVTRKDRIVVSSGVHPEARQVVRTYASGPGFAVTEIALSPDLGSTRAPEARDLEAAGVVLVQQPNFLGTVEDVEMLAEAAHKAGALLVVYQNPLTLGVLAPPGELGGDIAVGDVQAFGSSMCFGGPSAGYLACREAYLRQLPGRLVGRTIDRDGRACYTLTLQAREQHIRRAKATSNICSNQALNALAAVVYLSLLGPEGLRSVGETCLARAHHLQTALSALPGVTPLVRGPFFHEFALRLPMPAHEFARAMRRTGTDPGVPLSRFDASCERALLVAVTEMNPPEELGCYVDRAAAVLGGA